MHHPSERYIRFLLAESWQDEDNELTDEVAQETLKSYGLLEITDEQFALIREEFEPPEGFRFSSKKHQPTISFMKSESIYLMWRPDEAMERTLKELLGSKLVTETVHILLMGNIPSEVVATLINKRYRISPPVTGDMIDCYRHYFWYVPAWSVLEWEKELRIHPHADKYLASLTCGDQQALFRAGFNPKYDYKRALRDMHRQISFRIQAISHKPDDKQTIDLMVKMSREERALYERLHGQGGGLAEQAKAVRKFLMKHEIPDVKRLDEFIGETGSISGDGQEDDDSDQAEEDVDETTEE